MFLSSSLQARSLDILTNGHLNKSWPKSIEHLIPAPTSSGGKRFLLTKKAADAALDSLLGITVEFTPDLDGHDRPRSASSPEPRSTAKASASRV
jgi:hypothetical protein